jgi:ComF family protein
MHFLDTILEIVFPSKCIVCGKGGINLCLACISSSPPAERESAKWIFPLYDYRDPNIKKSLWFLKYKGKKRLAGIFAEVIYEKIMEELSELRLLQNFIEPILIPIPLSGKRYRERGFNQAELICQELIKIDAIRHQSDNISSNNLNREKSFYFKNGILIKPEETKHQAQIKDRALRLKNISGSFSVKNKKEVEGKNIILVDDILTTGATLSEARKVLKQAGARKIIAFTVAH